MMSRMIDSDTALLTIGHTGTREQKGILEVYPQGSLIRAKYPSRYAVNGARRGGGKRGPITKFTRKARARMRAFLGTIQEVIPSCFVTLTYGLVYPTKVSTTKEDLSKLWRGLMKRYPKASAVWLLHFQRRGAPHFHMIVWGVEVRSLRDYVKPTWHGIVANDRALQYKSTSRVERSKSLSNLRDYLSKPLQVPDWVLESGQSLGRCWGKKNEKEIPLSERLLYLVAPEFKYKIRRLYRRYLRSSSRKREYTLPVPNQILVVNPSRWAQCLVQLGYAEAVIDELQEYQDPGERRAQDREAIPNNRLFGLKGGLGIPQQDLGSK